MSIPQCYTWRAEEPPMTEERITKGKEGNV
jgi:hypothetical protein